ncbi:MAG: cobalamin B12-binding domain-containing protein [Theionarchaea archaeon]|nr:cobalamin B12-binding domain-containing protein [Theionarchaea archaeon]
MKCVLINPPYSMTRDYYEKGGIDVPLGIAYIASTLREAGIDVTVIDMPIERMGWKDLETEVERLRPDVVGITAITISYPQALNAAHVVKSIDFEIPVILGGPHATFTPRETLGHDVVDFVVMHEGEYAFRQLIENDFGNLNNIGNIAFKENGSIHINQNYFIENLDDLPLPARDLFPMADYRALNDFTSVLTSRGCPFGCLFCVPCRMFGTSYRTRTVEDVIREIVHLMRAYHFDKVGFVDDIFTLDHMRVKQFCEALKEIGVRWMCNSRVDTVDEELCGCMYEAGCTTLFFGAESGNTRVLDTLKKRIQPHQIVDAVTWAKDAGIEVHLSFIIGTPGETRDMIMETLDFIDSLDIDRLTISPLTPYPGTSLGDLPEEWGIKIIPRTWNQYNMMLPLIETKELSVRELTDLWLHIVKKYYVPEGERNG